MNFSKNKSLDIYYLSSGFSLEELVENLRKGDKK
jgi:hypothetical protein